MDVAETSPLTVLLNLLLPSIAGNNLDFFSVDAFSISNI